VISTSEYHVRIRSDNAIASLFIQWSNRPVLRLICIHLTWMQYIDPVEGAFSNVTMEQEALYLPRVLPILRRQTVIPSSPSPPRRRV
jgi:hypothetical protein